MTKETFVMAVKALKEQSEADVMFSENMSKCFPDASSCILSPNNHFVFNALLLVLQEATDDRFDYKLGSSWIEWWMLEGEFGKTAKAWDNNNKPIPMSTAEELYDYLMYVRIDN